MEITGTPGCSCPASMYGGLCCAIQIQMYNQWPEVQTVEYAEELVHILAAPTFGAVGGNRYTLRVPSAQIVLGCVAFTESAAIVQQGCVCACTGIGVFFDGWARCAPCRYPAAPEAVDGGYIPPASVAALVQRLRQGGAPVGGIMVWDLGWDATRNWEFASTVGALAYAAST